MKRPIVLLLALAFLAGCREGDNPNPRPSDLDKSKSGDAQHAENKSDPSPGGKTDPKADAKKSAAPLIERLGDEYGLIQISRSLLDRVAKNEKLKARTKDLGDFVSLAEGIGDLVRDQATDKAKTAAAVFDPPLQTELRETLKEFVPAETSDALLQKIEAARKK